MSRQRIHGVAQKGFAGLGEAQTRAESAAGLLAREARKPGKTIDTPDKAPR